MLTLLPSAANRPPNLAPPTPCRAAAAQRLIDTLELESFAPSASHPAPDPTLHQLESAVLQGLPGALAPLAERRCALGDSRGALLVLQRMVAEGSPPSDLVQRLVLASAADLPAPQLLRWLAIAFLGASPDPEAGTPSTLDMLAALLAGVSDAGARGMDPGRHAALALTLDRGAGRPAQALQHYERAFLLTQGGGVSSGAASGRGSAGSPGSAQLAPALAVLHALAAHRAGDARRAQRAVDAALHAAPAAPGLWLALAAGLAREGRGIVAARCALRAAVAGGPRATRPWDALALLLAAAGRPDLADISVHSRQHLAATGGGFQGLEAELLGELRRMQEGS
uniref:Uncharacterized protein n=1 Tax=Auxenochlorella protothecoides TaxID=3075 RepID=A0A1D1ZRP2_AUXPR